MTERDSLADLATRLEVVEEICLAMAMIMARQSPDLRKAVLAELEDLQKYRSDEHQQQQASIITAFREQVRLD